MKIFANNLYKILGIILLSGVILAFFYFETSLFLKILVVLLGLTSLFSLSAAPEIIITLILYLGLYVLYNVRYGLAVPLALIMILVFGLTILVFYLEYRYRKTVVADKTQELQEATRNIVLVYLLTTGLVVLEIFLAMSFWPVDPKIKSLVITVIFCLICRIFYLYINSVLNLKKIVVFILISILILGGVLAFNMFYGA